jgi:phosphohistidine phosphatase
MRLYLVQHGEAKSEAEDPDRPLTDRGVDDVRRVTRLATGAGSVTVQRIVHSGKERARQTAETWGAVLGVPVDEAEGLAPLDDPSVWAARLATEKRDLMLVGHLPNLAKLGGLLLVGDAERPVVAFRPGGLVGLEQGPAGWSVWLILPPLPPDQSASKPIDVSGTMVRRPP